MVVTLIFFLLEEQKSICYWDPMRILKSPFFYALLPSLLFYIDVFGRHWIGLHDTFLSTAANFFIFNDFVQNNNIALWNPFLHNGVLTTLLTSSSIQPALLLLLPVAKLLHQINFIHFYYLSILLEEIILLTGTYMLGRYLFKHTLATVFICIAIASSSLWHSQPYWNLFIYYCWPFCVLLTLQGFKENALWKLSLGLAIVMITTLWGNTQYVVFVQIPVYAVFLSSSWWVCQGSMKGLWHNKGRKEFLVWVGIFFLAGLYLIFVFPGLQVVTHRADGGFVISPQQFLSYGGFVGLEKFSELFTGIFWSRSFSTYAGILVLCFALFGFLWSPSKRQIPFLSTALFIALFSIGKESFVAPIFYYFPGIHFYRGIAFLTPLAKFFLVILAGFGLDSFTSIFDESEVSVREKALKKASLINLVLLTLMLALCLLFAAVMLKSGTLPSESVSPIWSRHWIDGPQYKSRVGFVVVCYLSGLFIFSILFLNRKKVGVGIIYALLLLQVVDVLSYRISFFHKYMVPVDQQTWDLFSFRPLPFSFQGIYNYQENPVFLKMNSYYEGNEERTELTKMMMPFLGLDACSVVFPSETHPFPWIPAVHAVFQRYDNNLTNSTLNKIIGCESPKLKVFEGDAQVPSTIESLAFDADHLELLIRTPNRSQNNRFLYYADAWHPYWRAYVNGEVAPILKANDAFKSVALPAGEEFRVKFVFFAPWQKASFVLIALFISAGVLVVFWFSFRLLFYDRN